MRVFEHPLYREDIEYVSSLTLPWNHLQDKSVMITGASGQIGSMIIDVLMHKNRTESLNCKIYALGRNKQKIKDRFSYCSEDSNFVYVQYDVNEDVCIEENISIDFIFHLASNTHPLQYATDPIGTITANVIGLKNLLDLAAERKCTRFIFASSNEIYGENRGDAEFFDEEYCGYINPNTLRAGYPESKRCGEALCQAYIAQKGLDVVIPRITRTYGPTLLKTDSKAMSQFLSKALSGEDIVLKSGGTQFYSYLYIADTISGIFYSLFNGKNGEAYNISDTRSDVRLRELASIIADSVSKDVVLEMPDDIERQGFSRASKNRLDSSKLKEMGWDARYDIGGGVRRTIRILSDMRLLGEGGSGG